MWYRLGVCDSVRRGTPNEVDLASATRPGGLQNLNRKFSNFVPKIAGSSLLAACCLNPMDPNIEIKWRKDYILQLCDPCTYHNPGCR